MSEALRRASWPASSLAQALFELARRSALEPLSARAPAAQPDEQNPHTEPRHVVLAAAQQGVLAEPLECPYGQLPELLARFAPGVVRITLEGDVRYLAVLRARGPRLCVLTPGLSEARVQAEHVRSLLAQDLERVACARVEQWLRVTRVPKRHARARQELLLAVLAERRVQNLWSLRLEPGRSFAAQLRKARVPGRVIWALMFAVAQVSASAYGWFLLGRGALTGSLEVGWLWAWGLTVCSMLPLQLATLWLGGRALTDAALLLKQRMLVGALRLLPDHIRMRGSGRLLAMVSECEAIEGAGLQAAFQGAIALVQLAAAFVILLCGASGALLAGLLALTCALAALLAVRFVRARSRWTEQRFTLAHDFVQNVIGQRTRVAQRPRALWHVDEDRAHRSYLGRSRRLDHSQQLLTVLATRGWLVLGFLGLLPALTLSSPSATALAVAVGGIFQAHAALGSLAALAVPLSAALLAWRNVRELHQAAGQIPSPGQLSLAAPAAQPNESRAPDRVLELSRLTFRYRAGDEPVLRDCSLSLAEGDRVLLEGPSGGGKSTLASLLVGLRTPESGHILLRGLDRSTLGALAWQERVVSAPQFHENHVLSGTLAFNLLMGRAWPPSDDDRHEAEALCRELGLGALLERMPSGLDQVVGETGWQLSHGERSRVFLARALLQRADVLILDESFGALDPHTLRTCMEVVFARARTLVVIAHP